MMYSACKLNRQGNNKQPLHTHSPVWNQSIIPCPVLTIASWFACSFLRRQLRWSGIPISLKIVYSLLWSTVKDFSVVNEAEIDSFLEFPCFFYDPEDVGNLISHSSAFSKSRLNIWKFSVHVLLKPSLENFERYFASVWDECIFVVVQHSLVLPFFRFGMKIDLFQCYDHCKFSKFSGILSAAI